MLLHRNKLRRQIRDVRGGVPNLRFAPRLDKWVLLHHHH
jgi:hypothetical protein